MIYIKKKYGTVYLFQAALKTAMHTKDGRDEGITALRLEVEVSISTH